MLLNLAEKICSILMVLFQRNKHENIDRDLFGKVCHRLAILMDH